MGTVLAALAFEAPTGLLRPSRGCGARSAVPCLCADDGPSKRSMSWQEGLESLLSPMTAQADREVLFKDLLNRGPEIADEVRDAVQSGNVETLLSPSQSKQLDDLKSVQRQLQEDILPQVRRTLERGCASIRVPNRPSACICLSSCAGRHSVASPSCQQWKSCDG